MSEFTDAQERWMADSGVSRRSAERMIRAMDAAVKHAQEHVCLFVPFPGNGAYGHWQCQLPKRHRGPHRFNNYTVPRVPRFWRLRDLWRVYRGYPHSRRPAHPYRRALYPTTYDPIPFVAASSGLPGEAKNDE